MNAAEQRALAVTTAKAMAAATKRREARDKAKKEQERAARNALRVAAGKPPFKEKNGYQGGADVSDAFMLPYKDKPKETRQFLVFDLESKKKDTQKGGFERPFMATVYDGEQFWVFRNDIRHKGRSYTTRFWHDPGGVIEQMCRLFFGLRVCEECEIGPEDYRFGDCPTCVEARKRFQKDKWIITAHNGGNFDNLFILGFVRRHKKLFDCDIVNVQSRMLILTVRPRGKKLTGRTKGEGWSFQDSIALMPLSLKEIGVTFCKEDEGKIDLHYDTPEDDERWEEYNKRDCYVLHESLEKFRSLIEKLGGSIGVTAASTAMQLLRRKFQKVPVHRNLHFSNCTGRCTRIDCDIEDCADANPEDRKCHGCMHDFVRMGFFGGRTEMFRRSGTRLFYYDINSSYPAAMLKDMPIGQAREMDGGTLNSLKLMALKYIGFVECVVEIPKTCYLPPLPYRMIKKTGEMKLIFPVGRLYGVWSWIELEEALKIGARIVSIGRSVWYQKGKLFDKMITTLYAYRNKICKVCEKDVSKGKCKCVVKTWDAGLDYCAKLMMNSCFGKLGINPIREKLVFPDTFEDLDESMTLPPPNMFESGIRQQHILNVDYLAVAIPALITADARVRLLRGLRSVLKRGGKIIYCDTDSTLATLPVEPQGGKLGQWKLEYKNFSVNVALPKSYVTRRHEDDCPDQEGCPGCAILHGKNCLGDGCTGCKNPIEVKMKGVPRKVQNIETWTLLIKGGTVKFERLTMHRSMLKRKLESPEEFPTEKSMKSKYDKRSFFHPVTKKRLPGGDTRPLEVNDPPTVQLGRLSRASEVSGTGLLDTATTSSRQKTTTVAA